jgi:hypothetical protein
MEQYKGAPGTRMEGTSPQEGRPYRIIFIKYPDCAAPMRAARFWLLIF